MGIIRVETPQGIVRVEIEGNEPTEQELQDIEKQFAVEQKPKTFEDLLAETKTTEQKQVDAPQSNFDTESGIQDFGLRSALSVAENDAEQEKILAAQGFTRSDYIRDNRGRLALTPTGAQKVGVRTDKNVLL